MKTRDIERAINATIKAKSKIEKMNMIYPKLYYNELNEIGKHVISKWYATYEPIYYHRQMSLKHAYDVKLHGTDYSVVFDSSLISSFQHHQDNDYIYQIAFIEGYHGGDTFGGESKGSPHPHPGIPYWRTPFPYFTSWGRPAKRSWSPYYEMVNQMNNAIKKLDNKKQKEFDEIIKNVQAAINRI